MYFSTEGLSIEKIKHRILSLQVYDFDRFSRNDPIGDVFLPLKNLQINEENFHSVNLTESRGSVSFYRICKYRIFNFENLHFLTQQFLEIFLKIQFMFEAKK